MKTMNDWVKDFLTNYHIIVKCCNGFDVRLERLFSAKAIKCIKRSSSDDIDDTVTTIMDMDEAFAHFYRFSYLNKTDTYNEYDGTIINAPTEECAWSIFLGMNGEYKIASAEDYSCTEVTDTNL